MIFTVDVKKCMYAIGTVEINCLHSDQAIDTVQHQIDSGTLKTTDIKWGDSQYEDCSFETTGDIS